MEKEKKENRTKEYENKIEQRLPLLKENFNKGKKEYKNFRELCTLLEIDYKAASSDSKKSIEKELKRYCNIQKIKNTHKLKIIEIYETAKEKEKVSRPRKSFYASNIFPLLVRLLYNKHIDDYTLHQITTPYPSITYYKNELFNKLGFTKNWQFYPEPEEDSDDELEQTMLQEFYDDSFGTLNQPLCRGLEYISKKGVIICQHTAVVYDFRKSDTQAKVTADEETAKIIENYKKQICKKYDCKTEYEFYQLYGRSFLLLILNKALEKHQIKFLHYKFEISLVPNENNIGIVELYNQTFPNMNLEQIQEKILQLKYELNQRIFKPY